MKILGIGLGNPYKNRIQKTNSITGNYSNPAITKPYALDSVSFGRVAENAEKMRCMFKYGVIDIHTGRPIIDPEWFTNALQNGIFERSIQSVVKTLKPLKDCLYDVEKELFIKIEELSKTHPLYRLDDAIKVLAPKAQEDLKTLQDPIFNKLKDMSYKLPSAQKSAFEELMSNTDKQRDNKPISYKFSKKEFRYQLERIAQDIKRRSIPEEIKTIKKLIHMSERIPYTPSGRNFSHKKIPFNPDKNLNQATMIRQLDNYLARSILKEDKSLKDLLSNAKLQVLNTPMVIPFKRKTFIYELQTILDTLEDKKLAHEFSKEAAKLPTAQDEIAAFIMKSSRNSSTKIGHDLLYRAIGDIDHLEPYSLGGADSIENYAFSTHGSNNKRGNKTLPKWIKENPQTVEGSQKCVDRLISLYRAGFFEKENFTPWYIINFVRRMEKLTSKENPVKLDYGTLFDELKQR